MSWLRSLLFRLQPLFRRRQIEAELADELRSHLDFATEAHLAAGLSPAEARRAAERELGGLEQIKENYRDQRSLPWLDQLQQDLRAAFRSLRKTPGFTTVAILSLAVAIGVNTTVFSLVNALLLRPLAPLRPDEIVTLGVLDVGSGASYRPFSHGEYLSLRAAKDTFADVAATFLTVASVADATGLHRSVAFFTSENYFSMLGVTPYHGRFFTAEECRPNANLPVIVASHTFWQRLGGRADFVGSTLRVNGQPYTVVGIAPPHFDGLNVIVATDCWVPLGVFTRFGGAALGSSQQDLADPKTCNLFLTARLAPGVSLAAATGRLSAVAQNLPVVPASDHPSARKLFAGFPSRQIIAPFASGPDRDLSALSLALLCLAGGVLLIASFNLGNQLLARGADRAKELAVRAALGATRGRLIRQLLTEGLLLASAGGVFGFILSLGANRLLYQAGASLTSSFCTFALNLQPDPRVLGATLLCCLFATLLFSLVPALKASRVDLIHDLQQQGAESNSPHRLQRFFAWRHVCLMAQIALCLAVIFSAALFIRGALKASSVPLGFDPAGSLVAELDYTLTAKSFEETKRSLFSLLDRISQQPGVEAAAVTTFLPYGNMQWKKTVQSAAAFSAGKNAEKNETIASYAAVSSGYLAALGVPLLAGRNFTAAEAQDALAPRVAIIDTTLAARLFPGSNPLGQRLRIIGWHSDTSPEIEVVGICAPHRHSLREERLDCVYVPFASDPAYRGSVYLHVRYATKDSAATLASLESLRATMHAAEPDAPVTKVAPFAELIQKHSPLWLARVGAVLLGTFGAIALLLAVIGVYGVKSYAVARRTREIGIRLALGASPRAAFALIFRQALLQIALALALGSLLALAAGRLLGSFVYRISGTDPLALAAAALLLALATLAACWLPARRATRVDPMLALRCE